MDLKNILDQFLIIQKGNFIQRYNNLIKNAEAFKFANDKIVEIAKNIDFDNAAIESRGSFCLNCFLSLK